MLLTALLLALPCAPAQDRIERADGRTVTGRLLDASLAEVQYAAGDGKPVKLPAAEVLGVEPAPATDLMRTGERAWTQRDWAGAANAFSAAAAAGGEPTWLASWAGLRHGESLLAWARAERGKAGDAVAALRAWCESHPDSFWIPRARIAQAQGLTIAGDGEGAARLLDELGNLAFEKRLAKSVELEIKVERSRAFISSRQASVAEAVLRDIAVQDPPADAGRGVRSRMLALRGEAQILLGAAIEAASGAKAAAAYWEGLARDPRAGSDVRAAALTGLATVAIAEGRLREAQLQLAEVVAVLDAGQEVRARALWELAEVTARLGDHPVNSRAYLERLLRECPDSSWAEPARAKLR